MTTKPSRAANPGREVEDMVKITAAEARKIAKIRGLDLSGDGITFYALDQESKEIYSFDSKKERDQFVKGAQK